MVDTNTAGTLSVNIQGSIAVSNISLQYTQIGNQITIRFPKTTATTNNEPITIYLTSATYLPTRLRPSSDAYVPFIVISKARMYFVETPPVSIQQLYPVLFL